MEQLHKDMLKVTGKDFSRSDYHLKDILTDYTVLDKNTNMHYTVIPSSLCHNLKSDEQAILFFKSRTVESIDPGYDPYWAGYVHVDIIFDYVEMEINSKNNKESPPEKERKLEETLIKEWDRLQRPSLKKTIDYKTVEMTSDQLEKALLEGVTIIQKLKHGLFYQTKIKVDISNNGDESFTEGDREAYVYFDLSGAFNSNDVVSDHDKIYRNIMIYTSVTLIKKFIRNPQYLIEVLQGDLSNDHEITFIIERRN
ncbi:hypothetical protein [Halalkalibacter oceani]|uniref:hypothetical protein n=1 Tax=Halalkalibacter oceani TaxID=1653776 RepID=UPI0033941684